MIKTVLAGLAFAGMMGTAQAELLLREDFNDVDTLPAQGWLFVNESTPPGPLPTWFQGDPETFPAHMGDPDAYIASNFNVAAEGGTIENWLITPQFSTANNVVVSFFLRGDDFPPFFDQIRFGFGDADGDLDSFTLSNPIVVPTDGWTQFTVNLGRQGPGTTARFAFLHTGPADTSNYVGLDTLRITAVPEPATVMILGIGLLGVAVARRRA